MKKDDLNFDDLGLIEIPVSIGGVNYTLREASEAVASQYQNELAKCVTQNAKGQYTGSRGPLADVQALMVSLCLFDESGNPVKRVIVKGWPTRHVKKIFNKAMEISEMAGEADTEKSLQSTIDDTQEKLEKLREDELGNEQSGTTDESA